MCDYKFEYIKELQIENEGLRNKLRVIEEERDLYKSLAEEYSAKYVEEIKKHKMIF